MIFFANAEGTMKQIITQPIYQGSSLASEIILIAPFNSASATCAFVLPNGVRTTERVMSPVGVNALQGQLKDSDNNNLYVWRFLMDRSITQYAGSLKVQFFIYTAITNQKIASFTSSLNIQEGVNVNLPTAPEPDTYQEILNQLSSLQLKLESGSFTTNKLFIKYSFNANGENMTSTWEEGQSYLGTYIGFEDTTDYTKYNWVQFVGGTYCYEDDNGGSVYVNITDQSDLTLTSDTLLSILINLPNPIAHGFYAGLNFKTGIVAPTVQIQNINTDIPLKIVKRAVVIENLTLLPDKNVQMFFYCDGLNVYCYVLEF